MATTRKREHDHSDPAPREDGPPEADLEARLKELEAELDETKGRLLRTAADFDNFRKRARAEQMDTIQYATGQLLERLLPFKDDLERAIEHAPDGIDEGWLRGLRLTVQNLEALLADQGVVAIEAEGQPFDPKLHEAVGVEESAAHPDDTVVAELRRGYRQHDRVLRPAMVRVSRRP